MIDSRKCAVCGTLGTARWTLNDGHIAGIVDLCPEHAEPLRDLLGRATVTPPGAKRRRQYKRHTREMKPLDWTPPANS